MGPLMRLIVPPFIASCRPQQRSTLLRARRQVGRGWLASRLIAADNGRSSPGDLIYFTFTAPAISLLDSSALQHLEGKVNGRYGRIRLWGSVGFALASLGLGLLYPDLPPHAVASSLLGSYLLFAIFLSRVRGQATPLGGPPWAALPQILKGGALWLLLLTVFLNRVASAPFNVFYTIFVGELGHGGELVAWTWGIGVAPEVLAMLAVDKIIDRLGADKVLTVGADGVPKVAGVLMCTL